MGQLEVLRRGDELQVTGNSDIALDNGPLLDLVRWLRFSVIQVLIQNNPELLWFHAGAAAANGRAILFPGPRGRGKSTLVTGLCARGWTYLSDDIVPLSISSGHVVSFPVTPARREFPGQEMPAEWLQAPAKVEVSVALESICRQPVSVGAVVFPVYCVGASLELTRCPPARAVVELLAHCWNFRSHRESGVRYLCGLVERLPVFHLSFSDGDRAAELLTESCPMVEQPC